jgi:hypothetical protein
VFYDALTEAQQAGMDIEAAQDAAAPVAAEALHAAYAEAEELPMVTADIDPAPNSLLPYEAWCVVYSRTKLSKRLAGDVGEAAGPLEDL